MDESHAGDHVRTVPHRLLYETACALAESATLGEAAPRMLRAVCEALSWEFGALWEVAPTRTMLRCEGSSRVESQLESPAAATTGALRPSGRGAGAGAGARGPSVGVGRNSFTW